MKKYMWALLLSIFVFQVGYHVVYPYFIHTYYQSSDNIYKDERGFQKAITQLLQQETDGVTFYVYQQITVVYNKDFGSSISCLIMKNKDSNRLYRYQFYRGRWHEGDEPAQYDSDAINKQELTALSKFKDISLKDEYDKAIKGKSVNGLVTVISAGTMKMTTTAK